MHIVRSLLAVLLGLVAASVIPAAAFALALLLSDPHTKSANLLLVVSVASLVAGCHAVFLGLPVAFMLRHLGKFTLLPVALAGFLIGGIPALLLSLVQSEGGFAFLVSGLVAGVLGSLGAAAFYAVCRSVWSEQACEVRGTSGA